MSCRNKCQTKISQEQREEVFKSYWAIGDVQGQWQFIINSHITVTEKARPRTRGNESSLKSRRSNTRAFTLCRTEVCKVMFLNTLVISDREMRTAIGKSKKGHTKPDKRGRNPSRCYPPEAIEEVKKHIKRFPVIESHYVREKSKHQFLSSNLNLHTMFELYLADSSIIKKLGKLLIVTYSTHALTLLFTNPRKIVAKCVSCLKMLLHGKKKSSNRITRSTKLTKQLLEKLKQMKNCWQRKEKSPN